MTQTIDQAAGRPNGHPGYCACPECFEWHQQKSAAKTASQMTGWTEPVLTPAEQTADYARRIHWWVRLFGIIWIVIPIAMMLFAVVFMIALRANSTTGY